MIMNPLSSLESFGLLGETHFAEVSLQYREQATSNNLSPWWFCVVPIVTVLAAWGVYAFVNRTPKIVNTPLGLLHELCKAHRVGRRGRVLLEDIARTNAMNQPATLFAGSSLFEDAVSKAAKTLRYNKRQNATLGLLRRRLFD